MMYFADRIGEHRAKTDEGFMIALGVPISRTGYQTYKARELQPSGVAGIDRLPPEAEVQVYRDGADVFEPAAMASFEGKSVTYTHPDSGLLNPDNDRQFARGHVQKIRGPELLPDGESALIADLVIKDSQLIQYIEHGVADEISCGYRYKLEPHGDGYKMTSIRGNHVAIVSSGRAGDYVKVLDAKPEEGSIAMEFKDVTEFFKTMGLRLAPVAVDAESETVTKQHEKMAEALKLKNRVMDAEEEEKEKKEKEAADKRLHDAEEKIEEVSKKQAKLGEAVDAGFKQVMDALKHKGKDDDDDKVGKDAKCTCDDGDKEDWEAEEGHKASAFGEHHAADCPMFKKAADDADLIPSETLTGKEVPENPIKGADALAVVDGLRKIRPYVADSKDKAAIDAFNRAMAAAKGRKPVNDADYAKILEAAATVDKNAASAANGRHLIASDALKPGGYQDMMAKYRRKNSSEWSVQ
jgi:hypothetical protein